MILDGVVGPARQSLRDLGPPVAKSPVALHQSFILFLCPRLFLDVVIQLVVPSEYDLVSRHARASTATVTSPGIVSRYDQASWKQ